MNIDSKRIKSVAFALLMVFCVGCSTDDVKTGTQEDSESASYQWTKEDGYIRASSAVESEVTTETNTEYTLSVPTYANKLGNNFFIVDCYHDQIIYNDNMTDPVNEWKVLTRDASQPHTMAGDGTVILVDDTENHRVLVFEGDGDGYRNTQVFEEIGQRPHYTVYDKDEKAFYVWSSTTGEMYIFRHEEGDASMYLTEIRRVGGSTVKGADGGTSSASVMQNNPNDSILNGTYIRSFYVDGDEIYFVSGITSDGKSSGIICCDKYSLKVKSNYNVPDALAGMAAMRYDAPYYYITVSTDVTGNQDAATIIRTRDLEGLEKGDYEDIYSTYFAGGGTPYNMFEHEGVHYLTEHRLPAHAVWSYEIDEQGEITNVSGLY